MDTLTYAPIDADVALKEDQIRTAQLPPTVPK